MSMMCRPMWPFLLTYGSHDIRHTVFPQVNSGEPDPWELGRHTILLKFGKLESYVSKVFSKFESIDYVYNYFVGSFRSLPWLT